MMSALSLLYARSLRILIICAASILILLGISACARFLPVDLPSDAAADRLVAQWKQTNLDLQRFKCVGKVVLKGPGQPPRSMRAALAGQVDSHLRIDLFAPFGGTTGTFASDGRNLFLVMYPSREYYKSRFGRGSLRRLLQIEITVDDLLELMVGRIPIDENQLARLVPGQGDSPDLLELIDSGGWIRQRITLDESMQPLKSEWFDRRQKRTHVLDLVGFQFVNGFRLPERIELAGKEGVRVTVALERYDPNAELNERLFAPDNPWS